MRTLFVAAIKPYVNFFFAAFMFGISPVAIAQSGSIPSRGSPVVNADGNYLYVFYLNEVVANNEDLNGEPPARASNDPQNRLDFYGWHRPNVRALVKRLERIYGVKAVSMTSWAMPTFAAYAPEAVLRGLRADPAVESVDVAYTSYDYAAVWTDRMDGGETIPWGKIAIGTDDGYDATTSVNRVYVIDGLTIPQPDLDFIYGDVNTNYGGSSDHASHVTGIVAGIRNGFGTRGVNPHNPVTAVLRGDADNAAQSAMDWVLYDAEQKGIYAVANFSSSGVRYAVGGAVNPFIRRASNRVLFVQAAGNEKSDACLYAYGPTKTNDGILVIGGVDDYGAQAVPYDNSLVPPYGWEPGSNWGSCVELWAPSTNIYSTWQGNPAYVRLSGTSMAAPHVAALAARYGGTSTTPVEREAYVRSKLVSTGYADISWRSIKIPVYTQPPAFTVPTRLSVANITADANQGTVNYVNDHLYLNNSWNAGHGATAWIELDLGTTRTITSIRMTPEQSPSGRARHEIYAGNSSNPASRVQAIDQDAATLEPLTADLNVSARYVRVLTTISPSWVAWREIELYGY